MSPLILHLHAQPSTIVWFWALRLPQGWVATLASAAIAFAVPLLFAGVGECIAERAGVLNIGVEGMMLCAALAAVAASWCSHSPWIGLLAGVAAATALGALFAALAVWRGADQVVTGTAVNILSLGVTGAAYFALSQWISAHGAGRLLGLRLPEIVVPGPSGKPLLAANVLVYAAFLLVPAAAFLLQRTRPGLQLRAVGEHPQAAEAAGISVRGYRFGAAIAGAALAGLGGVFLSIGHVASFAENMTGGKGFIALALVIFGRWNPWGAPAGCAVFSLAWGFGTVLSTQGKGRPEEVILLALPYLATLVALVIRSGRTHAPAALGQPHARA